MCELRVLALTARTATILLTPDRVLYQQSRPIAWRLETCAIAAEVAQGEAGTVVVFLANLQPATDYMFRTGIGDIGFQTGACMGHVDLRDVGGDQSASDNSDAFQRAIDLVPEGGTLVVPSGRFATRPIFLKPRMTLHLAEGAEIAAIADRTAWPKLPARDDSGRALGTWEGLPDTSYAAVVTAIQCDGLAITGRGIIDGGGDRGDWWTWPKERRDGARRPRVLHIAYSDDVSLSGITVRNAPSWTIHPYRCQRLLVAGIHISNPPDSPNTDGLNPESCEGVEIVGVDISVGDDCIAIKSGKRDGSSVDHLAPTRDVSISHCRMRRGHGAVVLGSEMSGDIENVAIRQCEFTETDRGLRLKTRRGRGGAIRNVSLSDCRLDGVHTPIAINAFYFCDPDGKSDAVQSREPAPISAATPVIEDIRVERVTATGVTHAAAAILGLPESPVRTVRLKDVAVSFDPKAEAGVPLMALGVEPMAQNLLFAQFADVDGRPEEIENEGIPLLC